MLFRAPLWVHSLDLELDPGRVAEEGGYDLPSWACWEHLGVCGHCECTCCSPQGFVPGGAREPIISLQVPRGATGLKTDWNLLNTGLPNFSFLSSICNYIEAPFFSILINVFLFIREGMFLGYWLKIWNPSSAEKQYSPWWLHFLCTEAPRLYGLRSVHFRKKCNLDVGDRHKKF